MKGNQNRRHKIPQKQEAWMNFDVVVAEAGGKTGKSRQFPAT